jgi:hypothetical protein
MIVPTGLMKQPQINAAVTPPTEFFNAGAQFAGLPLKDVAHSFDILQQQRHTADYDNGAVWSRTNAITQIRYCRRSFQRMACDSSYRRSAGLSARLVLPKGPVP